MATPVCLVKGCAQTPAGRCVQCGRTYCAQHGGKQAGYGACCRECYERIAQSLVVASHRAGQLPQALAALNHIDPGAAPPEHLRHQALALAASDDLDAAVDCLERMLSRDKGDNSPARQNMGQVLSARAARRLRANDTLGAVDDLRQAVVMSDAELAATQHTLLSALVYQSAFAYYKAGRLTDALREWEEAQARDPQNVQTAHYLGIVCYRLASETEERDPAQASAYWKKAIANWAMVLANEDYWPFWGQSRASAVGQVQEDLLKEVRQATLARLRNEFRNYRTHYLDKQQAAHAKRHAGHEVDFERELGAARQMREAMQQGGTKKQRLRSACGPLMLERWRAAPEGSDLVEVVDALARKSPGLQQYLSPLGDCYTLVKDMKRYEEAQAELSAKLKQKPKDQAAMELMVEALVEQGRNLMGGDTLERAVELFERAAGYAANQEQTLRLLAEAATQHARALLENEDTVQKALDMLERIRKKHSVRDAEFTAQLAQAYFKRGLIRNRKDDNVGALADIKKAIEIDPNNEAAKQNVVIAMMNRARELNQSQQYDSALTLITEALNINPGQVDRDLLGIVLTNRAIEQANDAVKQHNYMPFAFRTRQRLEAALQDLNTAKQLAQLNPELERQIQTQISSIYNLLRQL